MLFWVLSFFLVFLGLDLLGKDLGGFGGVFGASRQRKSLNQVIALLRELEETLMAGLVPSMDRWEALKSLPAPWGVLTSESLLGLRASGGSMLPTLKRLRSLAEEHSASLADAQAKSSQAFAQAGACASLVPLLGAGLCWVLPELMTHLRSWVVACAMALGISGTGAIWLIRLAETAQWAGLKAQHRIWILGSQCAGERFLALVRTGVPPDMAWARTLELLSAHALELGIAWGHSVWEKGQSPVQKSNATQEIIIGAGSAIKKAIQISLMEGRACTERVEAALLALRQGIKSQTEREISLLGTRALKPLFICVAPALLGLLFFGLWLGTGESLGEALQAF